MRAFLHIGTEKTGTTTLQTFLSQNKIQFLKFGFLIPESCGAGNNKRLAITAFDPGRRYIATNSLGIREDAEMLSFQLAQKQKLAKEITTSGHSKVIFSSEDLSAQLKNPVEIRRLKGTLEELGFDQFSVILYLREQSELVNSRLSTSIRVGGTELIIPAPASTPWYLDYKALIELWSETFGLRNLNVRLFDQHMLPHQNLTDDFLDQVGIEDVSPFEPVVATNASLSPIGLEILRRLNRHIPLSLGDKANPDRKGLVELIDKHLSGNTYLLSPETLHSYRSYFSASNEWVRKSFFSDQIQLFPEKQEKPMTSVQLTELELDQISAFISDVWQRHRLD